MRRGTGAVGAAADPRLRAPLLVLTVLILQTVVLARFRILGVMPDAMLMLAIAGGIVAGPVGGAGLGFGSGIAIDLFLHTPFGLSALVYSLVGYAVGVGHSGVLQSAWYLPVLSAMAASAGGVLLFSAVASVLGQPVVAARLPTVAVVVACVNAVLCPVMVPAVSWALTGPAGRRREP